jgi:hypothetical protein
MSIPQEVELLNVSRFQQNEICRHTEQNDGGANKKHENMVIAEEGQNL